MESSHSTSDIDGSVGIGGANDTNITMVGPKETVYVYIHNKTSALCIKWEQRWHHTHLHGKHVPLVKAQIKQLRIKEYDSKEPQILKLEGEV